MRVGSQHRRSRAGIGGLRPAGNHTMSELIATDGTQPLMKTL